MPPIPKERLLDVRCPRCRQVMELRLKSAVVPEGLLECQARDTDKSAWLDVELEERFIKPTPVKVDALQLSVTYILRRMANDDLLLKPQERDSLLAIRRGDWSLANQLLSGSKI